MANKIVFGSSGISVFFIIAVILAYFQYGTLQGVLFVALYYLLTGFAAALSLIPFVGVILYYFVSASAVTPWLVSFTGVQTSWVTDIIFWAYLIVGVVLTAITTVVTIAFLKK